MVLRYGLSRLIEIGSDKGKQLYYAHLSKHEGQQNVNQQQDTQQQNIIWVALQSVMDPEVGINIVDMGMVYSVVVSNNQAKVAITMTSPSCPLHVTIRKEARQAIMRRLPKLHAVDVRVVWEPPWTPELMTDEAKKTLGW